MYVLSIESKNRTGKKISLLKDQKIIGELSGDIDLVSSTKKILDENNIKITDIDNFKVNNKEGTFTGLKIGVTISNIFNWLVKNTDIKDLDKPQYGKDPNISKPKKNYS